MIRRRGFTLVELSIVLTLIAVVLAPLFFYEQKARAATQRIAARAAAHQEARFLMARVIRDLTLTRVTATARADGYVGRGVTCVLQNKRLLRNGVALGALPVDDFVVWKDGNAMFVTLSVNSTEGPATLTQRAHQP